MPTASGLTRAKGSLEEVLGRLYLPQQIRRSCCCCLSEH